MTNRNIIAIDGPAASGKGTLARKIAEKLNYAHMDTGLLYRAVAHMVLEAGDYAHEAAAAIKAAQRLVEIINSPPPKGEGQGLSAVASAKADGGLRFLILGAETPPSVTPPPTPSLWEGEIIDLKDERITEAASFVASMADVRRILLDMQKSFAANPGPAYHGAVLDGRDIGTVICPEARAKLFVTATLETRAERRFKELQHKGIPVTYEAVLRDMSERDARDAARQTAPMKAAADAVILDTTNLNQAQALEKALEIIQSKL